MMCRIVNKMVVMSYLLEFDFWRRFCVETGHRGSFECEVLPKLLYFGLLIFLIMSNTSKDM